jgi:hypothetical protein
MYNSGLEIPKVSFSAIDYTALSPGSYFTGYDSDNDGKLSKLDHFGNLTVIESTGTTAIIFIEGDGEYSTLRNNNRNTSSGYGSTVTGGLDNESSGTFSIVAGGNCNISSNYSSTVSGGRFNYAHGCCSTIGGGACNLSNGYGSSIIGGVENISNGCYSSLGGGLYNSSCGNFSTIAGGYTNTVSGLYSTVSGGSGHIIGGNFSTISGGQSNTASSNYSGILGGKNNDTGEFNHSMIVGSDISANRECTTFVNNLSILEIPDGSAGLPSGAIYKCSTDCNRLYIVP